MVLHWHWGWEIWKYWCQRAARNAAERHSKEGDEHCSVVRFFISLFLTRSRSLSLPHVTFSNDHSLYFCLPVRFFIESDEIHVIMIKINIIALIFSCKIISWLQEYLFRIGAFLRCDWRHLPERQTILSRVLQERFVWWISKQTLLRTLLVTYFIVFLCTSFWCTGIFIMAFESISGYFLKTNKKFTLLTRFFIRNS